MVSGSDHHLIKLDSEEAVQRDIDSLEGRKDGGC